MGLGSVEYQTMVLDPNLGESINKEEVIMDDEELILELDDGPCELDFDSLDLDQESWEWIHDQVVFEDNEYELD
jgi:hypothetical protein